MSEVRGYKVFNPDWICRDKQYACPGKFEEDVTLDSCASGMHFCKKAADCFNYYDFNPKNKVAEVIAYGNVLENGDKRCTDKLEIVRELSWNEVLDLVNIGNGCTGMRNSGNRNSGDWNSGDWNSGNRNSGDWNSGDCNSGDYNSGNRNSGDWNSGDWNSGNWNSGDWNSGDYNSGNRNSGNCNSGNQNSGNRNSGNRNSGNWNSGDWNSGNRNSGNRNSGDWNKSDFSNGCFNTIEPKIYIFNKPSDLTYRDWRDSDANYILSSMPLDTVEWVRSEDMTEEEKAAHPEHETTGGYLKQVGNSNDVRVCAWWHSLSKSDKETVMSIPNFDKAIFKEITGIDVDADRRHVR